MVPRQQERLMKWLLGVIRENAPWCTITARGGVGWGDLIIPDEYQIEGRENWRVCGVSFPLPVTHAAAHLPRRCAAQRIDHLPYHLHRMRAHSAP